MRAFALHDAAGTVAQRIEFTGGELPSAPAGYRWTEVPMPASDWSIARAKDGSFAAARVLVTTAEQLKAARKARWQDAKAYRSVAMAAGCATPLGRVQTDASSRDAITQAAADAVARQLAVPAWSIAWIMADNTTATHNAAQMIAMAAAVRTYIAACQAASQVVRKTIDAAATAAAVAAVDITAGYPA